MIPSRVATLISEMKAFLIAATIRGIAPDLTWLTSSPQCKSRPHQAIDFRLPGSVDIVTATDFQLPAMTSDNKGGASGGLASNFDSQRYKNLCAGVLVQQKYRQAR